MTLVSYRASDLDVGPVPVNGRPFDVKAAVRAAKGTLTLEDTRYPELVKALDLHGGAYRIGESSQDYSYLKSSVRVIQARLPKIAIPVQPVVGYRLLPVWDFSKIIGATTTEPPVQTMVDVYSLIRSVAASLGQMLPASLPLSLGGLTITSAQDIYAPQGSDLDKALAGFPTLLGRIT